MRRSVFQVMLLSLVRDRGALISSFVLPGLVFLIFAVIFTGTTGGMITVRLAIADLRQSEASNRLVEALVAQEGMRRVGSATLTSEDVRDLVRSGTADVGLVVRRSGPPLGSAETGGAPALQILSDPAREISVMVLKGALQKAHLTALPDAPFRQIARVLERDFLTLDPAQKARLDRGLDAMRAGAGDDKAGGVDLQVPSERVDVAGSQNVETGVAYYAGAVAILFLLLSAANGAITLLDEKETGLLDRVAIGPGGMRVVLEGKFAFLVVQGMLQVLVIYLIAWAWFGLDLPGHILLWAATTFLAATAAAGLGLLLITLCTSRQQAQTLANIVILMVSAIGGSMVPRFLMPDWIQRVGWLTPNTWTLEAYGAIFWRGEGVAALVVPWAALAAAGLMGLAGAVLLAQRRY
ncbi:MAG: ABC transporter permease [Hyphomicrobiales bacterium]|nr:ABC transporter permease [Hyphomicrobiales bacterium]